MKMTKKELIEKCRNILYSNNISNDNHNFLLSILELHPNYDIKFGVGIKKFFVEKNIYGTIGFRIKRTDGSTTDFSFYKCITNPSKEQLIKRACRDSIKEIIYDFKTESGTHIHHDVISFNNIILEWLKTKNLDLRTNGSIDNCQRTYFLNQDTINSFIKFHNKKAKLVELSIEEHKQIHKRG